MTKDVEEITRRVIAMLDHEQKVIALFENIKTPQELKTKLDKLKTEKENALKLLKFLKREGIFKLHWKTEGMEEHWREWARERGIKEGDFLFEN